MLFRGEFPLSIDAKGRVSFPARFRDIVLTNGDPRLVVAPNPIAACLDVYPMSEWEVLEQKVAELPRLNPNIMRFRRLYISAANECEIDKAGRLLVPQHLRERASLEKDVRWAGMGKSMELWSIPLWKTYLETEPEVPEYLKAIQELINI